MLVDQCLCYVEFDKDGKCLWVLVEIGGMVMVMDVDLCEIINMLYWIDISIQ